MKRLLAFALLCSLFSPALYAQLWTSTDGPNGLVGYIAADSLVVAVKDSDVYLRTPGAWSAITPAGPTNGITAVAVKGSTIFLGHYRRGILRSTDRGVTWTPANVGLSSDSSFVQSFAVDGNTLYVGAYNVYKSIDNGLHWTFPTVGFGKTPGNVSTLAARGGHVYAGTGYYPSHGKGVYHSSDAGAHWELLDSLWGVKNYFVYALAPTDSLLYVSAYQGVFRRPIAGGSWTLDTSGLSLGYASVTSFAWRYPVLFAGGFIDVSSTLPGSGRWSHINRGLVGYQPRTFRAMAFAGDILYAATDSLVWTLNLGAGPSVIAGASVTGPGLTTLAGTGASVSFSSVGTPGSVTAALFVGPPLSPVFSGRPPDNFSSPSGLLTGPTGVSSFRWVLTPSGLGSFAGEVRFSLTGLARGISNPSDITIYRRAVPDSGQFSPVSTSFNPAANELRAPITALGEFVLGSNTNIFTALRQPVDSRPGRFELLQNYPNPFNPTTTIAFTLPEASHVSVAVHNLLGQRVAEVLNADVGPGHHELRFVAHNLASGIYFYQMRAGSFVDTKKLILAR